MMYAYMCLMEWKAKRNIVITLKNSSLLFCDYYSKWDSFIQQVAFWLLHGAYLLKGQCIMVKSQ